MLQYVSTSLRDIKTQPLRCFLTVSAVALSSALLITLATIGITTRDAIISHFQQGDALSKVIVSANSSVGGGFFSSNIQETRANAEKLTDTTVSQLAALEDVKAVTPQASIVELKSFTVEGSDTSYVATVIATSDNSLSHRPLVAGNWFANNDTTPKVVLGHGYLQALGINDSASVIGKKITFTTHAGYRGAGADIPDWSADKATRESFNNQKTTLTATIVGVSSPSVNDNQLYIPLGWGHQIETVRISTPTGENTTDTLEKNGYSSIAITASSQSAVASLSQRINELGYGTITYQRQIDQLNQLSVVLWIVLGAVALISLISASLGIVNTLLMSISEQKHTIRIWRAAGASKALISRLYILQAAILSSIGALVGAVVGATCCLLINSRIETVLAAQGMETIALPRFSLPIIAASIVISIIIALIAALYPARVASRKFID